MVSWLFGSKARSRDTSNPSGSKPLSSPTTVQIRNSTPEANRDDIQIDDEIYEMVMNEQVEREWVETEIEQGTSIRPFHEPIKPVVVNPDHALLHRQAIEAINDRNFVALIECVNKNPNIILYPCHKQNTVNMKMIHGARGGTLLHCLASDKPKLKVGGGDLGPFKKHDCEMHVISSVRRKIFYHLTQLKPEALWTIDDDGRLPLHRAVMAHATTLHEIYATLHDKNAPTQLKNSRFVNKQLNVIELLLNLYPSAASTADIKGNLPLHYAMNFPPDITVPLTKSIDSLLQEKNFPTLKKKSSNIRKYFSSLGAMSTAEILYIIVDAYTEGLSKKNDMLNSPIHVLCSKGPMINMTSLEVLLYLHCTKKMSLIDKNGNDDQPLHQAIKTGAPIEAIKLFATVERIFHNNLSLFTQREVRGLTPLMLALESYSAQTSLPLILLILEAAPSITVVPDEQGLLPIVCATRLQLPDDVIRKMLERDMPIELGLSAERDDTRNDVSGNAVLRLHHHSFWHVSVNCEDRYLEMIRHFLVESATLFQIVALAQQVGPDGIAILTNMVSSTYRHMLRSLLILYHRYEIETSCISELAPFTLFALDRGVKNSKSDNTPRKEIRKVLLRCYLSDGFLAEKNIRKDFQLSSEFIEQVVEYHSSECVDMAVKISLNERFYFISYERPFHTLEQVFAAVAPWERTGLWFLKCAIVIGQLLNALHHLHERNLIHGHLEPSSIGKYGNTWKLMNVGLAARVGDPMRGSLRSCAPPEAVRTVNLENEEISRKQSSPNRVQFASDKSKENIDTEDYETNLSCCVVNFSKPSKKGKASALVFDAGRAQPTWDIFGLGLILAQLFLGSSPYLPNFEKSEDAHLRNLTNFNLGTLEKIQNQITMINEDAADLVGKLLHPDPARRPHILEIQRHQYITASTNHCQCV